MRIPKERKWTLVPTKEIKICTIYEDPITVPEIEDLFYGGIGMKNFRFMH
jgi:hypothetical protein